MTRNVSYRTAETALQLLLLIALFGGLAYCADLGIEKHTRWVEENYGGEGS